MSRLRRGIRHLVIVLGDQLNEDSAAFDDFDSERDVVWMAEVAEESTHVWTHKVRIAYFLACMRHFRDSLRRRGIPIVYRELDAKGNRGTLKDELIATARQVRPRALQVVQPGEWRVLGLLREASEELGLPLIVLPDRHFLCDPKEFAAHVRGRNQLRLEYFYREMRRRTGILMEGNQPVGGVWNLDAENRRSFAKHGPDRIPKPVAFPPDATTRSVLSLVNTRFTGHPGRLEHFDWPVTPAQARESLADFIRHRLAVFGPYQDAMWTDQPYLYHSRISATLNLKLLDPREVLHAAESAYRAGDVPLASAEGFIRQILGWREYVRGVYWHAMPEYLERNGLAAEEPLPDFYWTAETDMACLQSTIQQTLDYGYAHHIQRLMVTGLFALLLGVHPQHVHRWYLAVYLDAVEWVELPNTLGMSQYADGGTMASKPYIATGKYIERMSNYCRQCRYRPAESLGETACPFTTLYWDFLQRHRTRLEGNSRMALQFKNLDRKGVQELADIQEQATRLRATIRARGGSNSRANE